MRLYSGMSEQFISDTVHNSIAEKLRDAYFMYFRAQPGPAEMNTWRNSLRSMALVLQHSNLLDHGVILEYQLPLSSKRLDCMVLGRDDQQADQAVIVELKQWDRCESSESDNEVITWVGGAYREVLHPSVQVGQYRRYLWDNHTAFYEGETPVQLSACSYLHNYNCFEEDVLLDPKFDTIRNLYPIFFADQVENLKVYLQKRFPTGKGKAVLRRVEAGGYRPSKKLMQHVGNLIKGNSEYVLLDEQLIVYDKVMSFVRQGFRSKSKSILIVKGGPGTGKSVIALNLMADLLLRNINAHYATGSKAFTETLREIIGNRGSEQFKYFNSYVDASPEAVDVLICDEAHRIRKTSNNRFTAKTKRSNLAQIDELFHTSKVSVYFVDDKQVVRPDEIGSSDYVKQKAQTHGFNVSEYELDIQFRCGGSEAFVNWINNTLGIERTAQVIWEGAEGFDFRIFDSPNVVESELRNKISEGYSARMTAGFCWPWSDPNEDGTLVSDVRFDDYVRPWNAKHDAKRLAKGIPRAQLWAYDPNGIDQVGCIYTAQGFEFDYVGVIFGKDLYYDMDRQEWVGDKKSSYDRVVKRGNGKFLDLVRNTYRVLMSRGMKGCYVYFIDKDTERFFKTRIESKDVDLQPELASRLRILPPDHPDARNYAFRRYLPIYSLQVAAGYFGAGHEVEAEGWVEWKERTFVDNSLFVSRVFGKSMEPKIQDGDYCVFRSNPVGSRQGKIVLAQHRAISDPETGGSYTVKQYGSEKRISEEKWEHKYILLKPLNPDFHPIELIDSDAEEVRIIAELIEVIGK